MGKRGHIRLCSLDKNVNIRFLLDGDVFISPILTSLDMSPVLENVPADVYVNGRDRSACASEQPGMFPLGTLCITKN